MVYEVILHQ